MPVTPLEYSALPAAHIGHHLPFEPVRHGGAGHYHPVTGPAGAPPVRVMSQHAYADQPGVMRMHVNMGHGHALASGTSNYVHPTAHVHSALPHTDHWRQGFNTLHNGLHVPHAVPRVLYSHPAHGVVGSIHNPPTNMSYTGPQETEDGEEVAENPPPVPIKAPALNR